MHRLWLSWFLLVGCTKVEAESQPPPAKPAVAKVAARVTLTAVTLADDCGAAPAAQRKQDIEPSRADSTRSRGAAAARRCEQSSMQLAVIANGTSKIRVKSVTLLDESGKSLGALTASAPTRWSDAKSIYEAWDGTAASGTTRVSYKLSQPAWNHIGNRWNRTFTVEAVVSIGGVDQVTSKTVTLTAPASLPPNVRT
jgi:hypothetical protein